MSRWGSFLWSGCGGRVLLVLSVPESRIGTSCPVVSVGVEGGAGSPHYSVLGRGGEFGMGKGKEEREGGGGEGMGGGREEGEEGEEECRFGVDRHRLLGLF